MINRISSRDMSRLMSQLTTRSPYANVCTRSVYSLSRVVIIRRAVYIFLDTVALKDNTCLCVDAVWICIPCHQKKKKAFPPLLLALFQFCLHNVLSRKTTGECSKVCVTEWERERGYGNSQRVLQNALLTNIRTPTPLPPPHTLVLLGDLTQGRRQPLSLPDGRQNKRFLAATPSFKDAAKSLAWEKKPLRHMWK